MKRAAKSAPADPYANIRDVFRLMQGPTAFVEVFSVKGKVRTAHPIVSWIVTSHQFGAIDPQLAWSGFLAGAPDRWLVSAMDLFTAADDPKCEWGPDALLLAIVAAIMNERTLEAFPDWVNREECLHTVYLAATILRGPMLLGAIMSEMLCRAGCSVRRESASAKGWYEFTRPDGSPLAGDEASVKNDGERVFAWREQVSRHLHVVPDPP